MRVWEVNGRKIHKCIQICLADVFDKKDKTRFEMRETQQTAVIWTHVCLCREHKVDYKASQVFLLMVSNIFSSIK